jgi:hypothetical protein
MALRVCGPPSQVDPRSQFIQLPLLVSESIPERLCGCHSIVARAQGVGRRIARAFCRLAHVFGVAPGLFGSKPRLFCSKTGNLRVTSDLVSDLSQALVGLSSLLCGLALLLGNLALLLCDLALRIRVRVLTMPLAAFRLAFVPGSLA